MKWRLVNIHRTCIPQLQWKSTKHGPWLCKYAVTAMKPLTSNLMTTFPSLTTAQLHVRMMVMSCLVCMCGNVHAQEYNNYTMHNIGQSVHAWSSSCWHMQCSIVTETPPPTSSVSCVFPWVIKVWLQSFYWHACVHTHTDWSQSCSCISWCHIVDHWGLKIEFLQERCYGNGEFLKLLPCQVEILFFWATTDFIKKNSLAYFCQL